MSPDPFQDLPDDHAKEIAECLMERIRALAPCDQRSVDLERAALTLALLDFYARGFKDGQLSISPSISHDRSATLAWSCSCGHPRSLHFGGREMCGARYCECTAFQRATGAD